MNGAAKQAAGDEPVYNIGAAARMTGVAIATLRAWERRYGFPESGRTPGGHRLYSGQDVRRLRWIKDQVDQGMRVSEAIRALKQYGEGPLPEEWTRPAAPGRPAEGQLTLPHFQTRLAQALVRHDTGEADQALGEALLLYDLDDLMLDVVGPTMAEIGQAWQDGRIDVATEHLSTNYLRHRLTLWAHSSLPAYPARPVVLACAPNELHEGSLLILAALLRRRRWPVVYLGQAVPLPDLANLVRQTNPQAVVWAAMTQEPAQALAEWPQYLPDMAHSGLIVGYGGRIFNDQPEWRTRVPGLFLGATLREGLHRLEGMLQGAPETGVSNLPPYSQASESASEKGS